MKGKSLNRILPANHQTYYLRHFEAIVLRWDQSIIGESKLTKATHN